MFSIRPAAALGAYLLLSALGSAAFANEPLATTPAPEAPATEASPPAPPLSPLKASIQQQLATAAPKGTDKADRSAVAAYYGEADSAIIWVADNRLTPRAISAIEEMRRAADWGLTPTSFDTPDKNETLATPEAQAAAEMRISLAALKYARHARGGRIDLGVLGRSIDQKPPVLEPRTVLTRIATASDAAAYLRGLHPKHPQFEKLRQALLTARKTPASAEPASEPASKSVRAVTRAKPLHSDATQHILVNMERWRWLPEDLGSFHVWDNIPEYRMRVMKDGKVAHTETIIVGKPSTPTPIFSADMKYVIFHPTWGVPDSIKVNEIAPSLRRSSSFWGGSDPAILRRHDLRVSYNGRPVDPSSVDWGTVDVRNFQFTQPPSSMNVLGVVKFRFPNKHDVYMHDTPERDLFSRTDKAFSHGCMRVKNPRRLAEVLLAEDKGWSSAQVGNAIAGGATQEVTLAKQIPVHVTYFTAVVDDDGQLKTYGDIYGHDSRVSAALEGRPIRLIAQADPAVRETRRTPIKAYRQPNDGGLSTIFSGLFGN
jgi:L,D-transpeptidase YcbB